MAIYFDPLAPAPEEPTGLLGRVQFDRSAPLPGAADSAQPQYAAGYNPDLGRAPTPEGYVGRPDRQLPSYFGINTAANDLAAAYNDLAGYGVQDVADNSDAGTRTVDTGVRIDPWSGGVTQSALQRSIFGGAGYKTHNDFQVKDQAFFDRARELVSSLDGLSAKDRAAKLRTKEYQDALGPLVAGGETSYIDEYGSGVGVTQNDRLFNMLGSESSAFDQYEADYTAKRDRFTQAKEGYETAFGQVQERFMSPVLDEQLRAMMPDDGKSWDNKFTTNYDHHINSLNYMLKSKGVEDLREITWTDQDGKKVFYNRRTGHGIDPDLLNYKGGSNDGNLTWKLKALPDGQVTFDTNFKEPSKWAGGGWIDQLAPVALSFALGPVGSALGGAIGSSIGGVAASAVGKAAIGGALTGGISSAIFGGDPLKGALAGGLGAGAGTYAAGKFMGAKGVNPALMSASPQLASQAGLVGSFAGNAAGDLVMGRSPTDRYTTTGGQLGLARHLFAI